MNTIKFTIESLNGFDLRSLELSYFTLCRIQERIKFVYPSAESIALWMKQNGYVQSELSLDRYGNYISFTGRTIEESMVQIPKKSELSKGERPRSLD